MPVEQAVLQNPKFVTEEQNVLVNEGDNIRSLASSSSSSWTSWWQLNAIVIFIFQTAMHSGQAGRICDAVEKRERHHHCCKSNHWQGAWTKMMITLTCRISFGTLKVVLFNQNESEWLVLNQKWARPSSSQGIVMINIYFPSFSSSCSESNLFEQFPSQGSLGQINCYNGRAKKTYSKIEFCPEEI